MAMRTVGDLNEEGKREGAEAAALDELRSALVETVSGQVGKLAARLMESSGAAVVDGLIRETMLEAGRRGLEKALERVPTTEDMTTLRRFMTRDGRREIRSKWQVDFYIADANSSAEHDYWLDLLSRNPDQSNRKGIPFVAI